jgi:hypothetical protein
MQHLPQIRLLYMCNSVASESKSPYIIDRANNRGLRVSEAIDQTRFQTLKRTWHSILLVLI